MGAIFLSYRRADTQGWAGRLSSDLLEAFGSEPVFFDLQSIQPGDDFVVGIQQSIATAEVVLALIGPNWSGVVAADGSRRLDNPADFVRLELATALRQNIRVIPILVGDAAMPSAAELPDEISVLARRQAIELTDSRWEQDLDRLLTAVERATGRTRMNRRHARGPSIEVASRAMIEGTTAGDVAGIKTDALAPSDAGGPIHVLSDATIRDTRLGDIVGIKIDRKAPQP